jgi:hypothetical protein
MKKPVFLAGIMGIALSLLMFACATAPLPEEEAPPAPVPEAPAPEPAPAPPPRDPSQDSPDQGTLSALAAAQERAEAARTRAFDFGGPEYYAQDWEAAESQYALAGARGQPATRTEAEEAIAGFNRAADAFDGVFHNALPKYAQAREDELVQARSDAIDAGALDSFTGQFSSADDTVDEALRLYEDEQDYYAAAAAARQALTMYGALKTGGNAYQAMLDIELYGFGRDDPEHYAAADEAGMAALAAYEALDVEEALARAEEALDGYNLVLETGWRTYAAQRAAAAEEERRIALELKANVAVRDDFEAAEGLYNQGAASYRAEGYIDAADLYFQAEFLFAAVSASATEKRRAAEEAIRQAEERAQASEAAALEAEAILEGDAQ